MTLRVTLRPSGRVLECASDTAVLHSALAQGVSLAYGCRTGTCGACRGRLAGGRVDYGGVAPLGLTDEERAGGYVLLCLARPASDLEVEVRELEGFADLHVKTLPARVERLERLSHDVMGLWLKLPPVERLRFLAGQYLDVLLPDGRRRSFSLANAPHDDALLELHVRQVQNGAFSTQVFEQLERRALLRVQGPLGTFFLRESSPRPIVMIGGGTGLAPLKSMIEHAFAAGSARLIHLYWGVRATRDLYLSELPLRWLRDHDTFRYTPVLSEPDPGWRGRTGWVHEAVVADLGPRLAEHDVYMAGPPAMCRVARTAFAAAGLPDTQLHYDSFEFSAR